MKKYICIKFTINLIRRSLPSLLVGRGGQPACRNVSAGMVGRVRTTIICIFFLQK
jgi:hypothetical protein